MTLELAGVVEHHPEITMDLPSDAMVVLPLQDTAQAARSAALRTLRTEIDETTEVFQSAIFSGLSREGLILLQSHGDITEVDPDVWLDFNSFSRSDDLLIPFDNQAISERYSGQDRAIIRLQGQLKMGVPINFSNWSGDKSDDFDVSPNKEYKLSKSTQFLRVSRDAWETLTVPDKIQLVANYLSKGQEGGLLGRISNVFMTGLESGAIEPYQIPVHIAQGGAINFLLMNVLRRGEDDSIRTDGEISGREGQMVVIPPLYNHVEFEVSYNGFRVAGQRGGTIFETGNGHLAPAVIKASEDVEVRFVNLVPKWIDRDGHGLADVPRHLEHLRFLQFSLKQLQLKTAAALSVIAELVARSKDS